MVTYQSKGITNLQISGIILYLISLLKTLAFFTHSSIFFRSVFSMAPFISPTYTIHTVQRSRVGGGKGGGQQVDGERLCRQVVVQEQVWTGRLNGRQTVWNTR